MNILNHIPTEMKKAALTNGGEYAGPCPWCGGDDRFRVWPEEDETGRYWCRQCERHGDGIQLLRDLEGMTFMDAKREYGIPTDRQPRYTREAMSKTTDPPPKKWQEAAWTLAEECEARLWSGDGVKAREWLHGRGLTDDVIRAASFGFNPDELRLDWGMDRNAYVARGITIPYVIGEELWGLNVRRAGGSPKYICATGSVKALYNADKIRSDRPIVLVEGEIDAWSVIQEAHEIAWAVATGSTTGARKAKWIARLMLCPVVLVAFDADKPGEDAAKYWTDALPNAVRWRPLWGDANQMLQDGADLRAWIHAGINQYQPMAA